MSLNVGQIADIMHLVAPPELAESWDNIGLQIGSFDWEVNKVWVSVDPLLSVVKHACLEDIDLLITHHPLFFKSFSKIDTSTTKGKIIDLALKKKLAIFCAHTNLDSVAGGINDILASKIDLINIEMLNNELSNNDFCKLVLFVPIGLEKKLTEKLFSLGAGQIGTYSCCSFKNKGVGTFLPGKTSNPYVGNIGILSENDEIRIEILVHKQKLKNVISFISSIHPYETVPYDIYPVLDFKKSGMGRIGNLKTKMSLYKLVKQIKYLLNLNTIKVSGDLNSIINTVAVCSGSGSSLMQDFFTSGAQVYVSGDITYHNAREANDMGLSVIDIGHFNSEQVIVEILSKRIKKNINKIDKNVSISAVNTESDVFKFI